MPGVRDILQASRVSAGRRPIFLARPDRRTTRKQSSNCPRKVAEKPLGRAEATAFVSDLYKLARPKATSLIDLCKSTAIIDEETDRDRTIRFNSNTFRDGQYAKKALLVLEALTADDRRPAQSGSLE